MTITSLKIRNLGNIDYFEAQLGVCNIILGGNDVGKSNVLRVFRWVFNGGNDPALLRDGCDEGWAEFSFSNGYKATKRLWIKEAGDIGYELKVLTPEGGEKEAAKTLLDSWLPKSCFDPDDFILNKNNKQRVKWLLQHVHLEFTRDEVLEALNPKAPERKVIAMTERARAFLAAPAQQKACAPAPAITKPLLSLEEFDELYKLRYSQRTELNRLKEQIDGAITTMSTGLQNLEDTNWGAERSRLEAEHSKLKAEKAAAESRLALASERSLEERQSALRASRRNCAEAISGFLGGITNLHEACRRFSSSGDEGPGDFARTMDQLAKATPIFISTVKELRGIVAELTVAPVEAKGTLSVAIAEATTEAASKLTEISAQIAVANEKADQQQRSRGVRNAIEEQQEYVAALSYGEYELTKSIQALERLKTSKLKQVNIKGFDITYDGNDPVISIDGRSFDRLNEQSQVFYAIRFMRLAHPELAFIICQSNSIDGSNLETLAESAEKANVQFVLERCIAEQPLRMMPADTFLEAEQAARKVLAERIAEDGEKDAEGDSPTEDETPSEDEPQDLKGPALASWREIHGNKPRVPARKEAE